MNSLVSRPYRPTTYFILVATLLLMCGTALGHAVVPRASLDHDAIMVDGQAVVYVLVEFDVAEAKAVPGLARPDLNVALVLDRSGSMEDYRKMIHAREAACFVVDHMGADDRLGVVEYDDEITVLWPAATIESRSLLKRRINALTPRGSTDLCGGMMQGVDELLPHVRHADITRVLLLSDGLANEGITDPGEIRALVREARSRGVTVSTLGLGLDYNEDLMQDIAEASGGNYYFIESPRQMRRIFARELDTLMSTVASNAVMRYYPARDVDDVDVYGYEFKDRTDVVEVEMENFYSGEMRSVLMRLTVDADEVEDLDLGDIELSFHDQITDKDIQLDLDLSVAVTRDLAKVEASRNDHVVVESTLTEADRQLESIVNLYETGQGGAAREALDDLNVRMTSVNAAVPSPKLSAKLESLGIEREDMDASDADALTRSAYLKQNKANYRRGTKGGRAYMMQSEGDSGFEVERLQTALRDLGLFEGDLDGEFTPEVRKAVEDFQRREGLKVDGMAGPRTLRLLGLY